MPAWSPQVTTPLSFLRACQKSTRGVVSWVKTMFYAFAQFAQNAAAGNGGANAAAQNGQQQQAGNQQQQRQQQQQQQTCDG